MRIGIDARPLSSRRTGIGNYLYNLLVYLQKLDNNNQYFLYSHRDFEFPFKNNKWHKRIGGGPFSLVGTLYLLTIAKRQMRSDNLDIFWGTQHVLPSGPKMKKVLTVHDFAWHYFPGTLTKYNLWVQRFLVKRSIQGASRIIVVSRHTARDLKSLYPVDPNLISVIYHGVNGSYIAYDREKSARYIADKFAASNNYILAVGTLEPRKNIETLLRAYRSLLDNYKISHQLLIVGAKGWRNSSLYKRHQELGFSGAQVKFLGYVPEKDMPKLYSGAEVFVFPSLYEGFGFPPLEAMACECPVVSSNSSSLPEVCGDAAYYVDPNDALNIQDGIYKVLMDKALRKKLVQDGIKQAALFSWENAARGVLEVLERVYQRN